MIQRTRKGAELERVEDNGLMKLRKCWSSKVKSLLFRGPCDCNYLHNHNKINIDTLIKLVNNIYKQALPQLNTQTTSQTHPPAHKDTDHAPLKVLVKYGKIKELSSGSARPQGQCLPRGLTGNLHLPAKSNGPRICEGRSKATGWHCVLLSTCEGLDMVNHSQISSRAVTKRWNSYLSRSEFIKFVFMCWLYY